MTLEAGEWSHIISWIVFVYWQLYTPEMRDREGGRNGYNWYSKVIQRARDSGRPITLAPPGWLFGIAWSILYGLIAATGYLFERNNSTTYHAVAILVLIIVNVGLNKVWSLLFFGMERTGASLLIAVLLEATGITALILMAITGGHAWLPFALYVPYVIWLGLATWLNFQWWTGGWPTISANDWPKNESESSKLTGNQIPMGPQHNTPPKNRAIMRTRESKAPLKRSSRGLRSVTSHPPSDSNRLIIRKGSSGRIRSVAR